MTFIKPIRIEPAFDDPEQVRDMFERHAPYRALAAYAPEGLKDETSEETKRSVVPWFRGDWALAGEPLVEGAELILHNKRFLEAAKSRLRHSRSCILNSSPSTSMDLCRLAQRTWTTHPFTEQRG